MKRHTKEEWQRLARYLHNCGVECTPGQLIAMRQLDGNRLVRRLYPTLVTDNWGDRDVIEDLLHQLEHRRA